MKLTPLADRVVLKMVAPEETTKSGIILTGSAQEKPSVAEVVAVGPGRTRVFAEYEGQKVFCWVSCSFPAEEPTEPTEPDEATEPVNTYSLMINGSLSPYGDANNASVTVAVGEAFRLTVEDEMGAFQQVEWTMSKDGVVSYDSNKVTGLAKGNVVLTATYEGQSFTCTVYVNDPNA